MAANVTLARRRITENLKHVRERIDNACALANRNPQDIRFVAVTKYVEMDVVRQALDLGILDLGESRAQQLNKRAGMMQEFIERKGVLAGKREPTAHRPRWHMVGHLQRNKVKLVVPWVEMIHSVDSLRLAEDLHTQATKVGRVVDILLQVNTSAEKSKHGVAVGAVTHLAEHFATWPGIRLCGLMTMGPIGATPMNVRLCFDRLRDVFEDMKGQRHLGSHFRELSMGMSGDYESAIDAGATLLRIGSALFEGLTSTANQDDDDAPGG